MNESTCTAAELAAVAASAQQRANFIAWLAEKLLHPIAGVDIAIRKAAAEELRKLVGMDQ